MLKLFQIYRSDIIWLNLRLKQNTLQVSEITINFMINAIKKYQNLFLEKMLNGETNSIIS